MVQTSQQRQRDDVAAFRWLSRTRIGAVLVQCPMCAVAVEIIELNHLRLAHCLSRGAEQGRGMKSGVWEFCRELVTISGCVDG